MNFYIFTKNEQTGSSNLSVRVGKRWLSTFPARTKSLNKHCRGSVHFFSYLLTLAEINPNKQ